MATATAIGSPWPLEGSLSYHYLPMKQIGSPFIAVSAAATEHA